LEFIVIFNLAPVHIAVNAIDFVALYLYGRRKP